MKMPLTNHDKKVFQESALELQEMDFKEWASKSFSNKDFRSAFFKMMNNIVELNQTSSNHRYSSAVSVENKKMLAELLLLAFDSVEKPQRKFTENPLVAKRIPKEMQGYSTGQIAKFLYVSITTINNWVKEGKFFIEQAAGQVINVERSNINEKLRFHPNTLFEAPTGVRLKLKDIAEAYYADKKEHEILEREFSVNTEEEQIRLYNDYFINKYHGTFEEVFGHKKWDELTPEEDTDKSMWSFFLNRAKNEENN
ncbi:hypothetical protein CN692_01275 [Bacillus sp. AFS002410]|uniref:hypothetical protein n=1 Tax=Bacillus sp. AFS002410 TaxID=2033481 RepID=UPI000BF016A3|nr:hypothetical protein [Bacillus sp. AFS002410]PEJ60751.1 hypothetical protein CN692_01275 [Bacillus sp. AFS002410]